VVPFIKKKKKKFDVDAASFKLHFDVPFYIRNTNMKFIL